MESQFMTIPEIYFHFHNKYNGMYDPYYESKRLPYAKLMYFRACQANLSMDDGYIDEGEVFEEFTLYMLDWRDIFNGVKLIKADWDSIDNLLFFINSDRKQYDVVL